MSNVVELRPESEDAVWRCNCGCITFKAHVDNTLECAQCGERDNSSDGQWVKALPSCGKPLEMEAQKVVTLQKTAAMTLRDLANERSDDEFVFVLAVRKSGKHTLWGGADTRIKTEEQLDWLELQFDNVRAMLVKR